MPAILVLLIYLLLAFKTGFGSINPFAWICISLMFAAAIVMSNGKWYGCIGGVIVGIILIYMSTQDTGQVIDIERPLGIGLCMLYLVFGFATKKKNVNQ